MTMLPTWKMCPRCHRMYDRNPDVGIMSCPYCFEKKKKAGRAIAKLFNKSNRPESGNIAEDDLGENNNPN